MDIKRFELTPEEIEQYTHEWDEATIGTVKQRRQAYLDYGALYTFLLRKQIAKVLSLFEPVELEAPSGNELANEIWHKVEGVSSISHLKAAAQRTLQHNQSKGQLYRLREGE